MGTVSTTAHQQAPIVVGSDHAGFALKQHLIAHLQAAGRTVQDVGCFSEASVDYPEISRQVAEAMQAQGEGATGLLCCGSGVGVAISANRFPWIRAVLAHEHHIAVMSRRHNDANVLCLGGRFIAPELAAQILDEWLAEPFEGERHQRRVDLMTHLTDQKQGSAC